MFDGGCIGSSRLYAAAVQPEEGHVCGGQRRGGEQEEARHGCTAMWRVPKGWPARRSSTRARRLGCSEEWPNSSRLLLAGRTAVES
jgi:hypothetical protein